MVNLIEKELYTVYQGEDWEKEMKKKKKKR